ncbi:MAG: hypothetical protein MJH08_12640 [Hyphomicrobiales bacterium]|nr:hypothetical protein [Hyphomicrobiales bacterium]
MARKAMLVVPTTLAICALSLGQPASAKDDTLHWSEWHRIGSVLLTGEYRDSTNNFAGFGNNRLDGFVELDVRFHRDFGPYQRWEGSVFGAYDQSDFRGNRNGLSAERFYLRGHDGAAAVPWRMELGDFFAFTSLRTLQVPLKGSRFEVQFADTENGTLHSGQIFAGSRVADYHQFVGAEFDDNFHAGYSHLVELGNLGSLMFTGLWNHNEAGGLSSDSGLFSVAAERGMQLGTHHLTFEGEAAFLTGDVIVNNAVRQANDVGLFGQISGSGDGWRYALRYEDYDDQYRPSGASVANAYKSYEARLGRRWASGLDTTLRLQSLDQNLDTANPIDTEVIGLASNWAAIPGFSGLSLSSDSFWRETKSRNGTTNNTTWSADISANYPINDIWSGTTRVSHLRLESGQAGLADNNTSAVEFSATRQLDFSSLGGSFSPGIVVRHEDRDTGDIWAVGPRLGLNLFSQNGHNFTFDASLLHQNGGGSTTADFNGGARYVYTQGDHRFSIEADYLSNWQDPGTDNHGFRLAFLYRKQFGYAPKTAPVPENGNSRFVAYAPSELFANRVPDLAALRPGLEFAQALARVSQEGLGDGAPVGNNRIYQGQFVNGLGTRQRLVLTDGKGRLEKSSILIDFEPGSSATNQSRLFARILERLINHYGVPERTIEDGVFSDQLQAQLASGQFSRIVEWRLRGGILRFGIPRRLDGTIRMELQFSASHPNVGLNSWSLEEVR